MARRNSTPSKKPPAAGSHPGRPLLSASSMAGMSRLHTAAATMTPAAKPRKIRWAPADTRLRKKNTIEAPRAVIRQVKPVPPAAHSTGCIEPPPFVKSIFRTMGYFPPPLYRACRPLSNRPTAQLPRPPASTMSSACYGTAFPTSPFSSRMELKKPCLSASTPTSRYIEKGRRENGSLSFPFAGARHCTEPSSTTACMPMPS